jgi:hypothetical protein
VVRIGTTSGRTGAHTVRVAKPYELIAVSDVFIAANVASLARLRSLSLMSWPLPHQE